MSAAGSAASTGNAARIDELVGAVRACRLCVEQPLGSALPHEPRPILQLAAGARLVIASQAPGNRAHRSGIPFRDESGRRLRDWLGLDEATFYDPSRIAIVPMGFCFPGNDAKGGDLPPRTECRRRWHDLIFTTLDEEPLILCVGLHSVRYRMARLSLGRPNGGLSDIVFRWRDLLEASGGRLLPLPHPSWRNTAWIRRNPWFEDDLLPALRETVRRRV